MLWVMGVDAYYSFKQKMFKLYATLMGTTSDFLGLIALSGWNMYTGFAHPSYNFDSILCCLPIAEKAIL